MVTLATLNTLAELEQEMARTGRVAEQRALHAVLRACASPGGGYLTTGATAAALGVSIPTVKRRIRRGVLRGVCLGTRWLVSKDSVDQALRLRSAPVALDAEGNPSPEEIQALLDRPPEASGPAKLVPSWARVPPK
jgi:excisionase family DNA binding protein